MMSDRACIAVRPDMSSSFNQPLCTPLVRRKPPKPGKINGPKRTSCDRCRRQRQKCDGGRPCSRCAGKTFHGCEDCDQVLPKENAREFWHPWQVSAVVQRPESFQSTKVLLPVPPLLANVYTKAEVLAKNLGSGIWLTHRRGKQLAEGMTAELLDVMIESQAVCQVFLAISGLLNRAPPASARREAGLTIQILDDDVCDQAMCVQHSSWGSSTLLGVSRIEFNRKYAEDIRGISAEELMARLAHEDLEIAKTEMETLCNWLDVLHAKEKMFRWIASAPPMDEVRAPTTVRYHVYDPGCRDGQVPRRTVLARLESDFCYDFTAGRGRSQVTISPCSIEEFDAAFLADPQRCRPFCAVMGDYRGASQLLADRPYEPRTLQQMLASPDGRLMVRRLTDATRVRVMGLRNSIEGLAAARGADLREAASNPSMGIIGKVADVSFGPQLPRASLQEVPDSPTEEPEPAPPALAPPAAAPCPEQGRQPSPCPVAPFPPTGGGSMLVAAQPEAPSHASSSAPSEQTRARPLPLPVAASAPPPTSVESPRFQIPLHLPRPLPSLDALPGLPAPHTLPSTLDFASQADPPPCPPPAVEGWATRTVSDPGPADPAWALVGCSAEVGSASSCLQSPRWSAAVSDLRVDGVSSWGQTAPCRAVGVPVDGAELRRDSFAGSSTSKGSLGGLESPRGGEVMEWLDERALVA